jgi:hypothetical protein
MARITANRKSSVCQRRRCEAKEEELKLILNGVHRIIEDKLWAWR